MNETRPLVSLGFTQEQFPAGVHICQIFSDDEERDDAVLQYIESGLKTGERTACYSDSVSASKIHSHLQCHGVRPSSRHACDQLTVARTGEVYLRNGRFDPDRMLAAVADYYDQGILDGYGGVRVIGEMPREVRDVEGGDRLLEYESKISQLQRERPVTCVCQYDARCFDGAMIMDVLKVHPLMAIRGTVVRNPFYVSPEEYLKR